MGRVRCVAGAWVAGSVGGGGCKWMCRNWEVGGREAWFVLGALLVSKVWVLRLTWRDLVILAI